MSKVSFDFDNTLILGQEPNQDLIETMLRHAGAGSTIVIVTSRNRRHERKGWAAKHSPGRILVWEFIKEHKLPVSNVYFTNHKPKGSTLARLGVVLHYDDDPDELRSCGSHGVEGIAV